MQLDWIHNAQFAGLYQAVEMGYYTNEGLDVKIRSSGANPDVIGSVLSTDLAFGSGESNLLLAAHAKGANIKALATMFQGSPMGWIYLPDNGIESIKDLAGKRIGIHTDGEKVVALVASRQGFEVKKSDLPHVGYDIAPLLAGELDAMQAYSIDEFVSLKQQTDGQGRMFMASDYGYRAYSQVIFTNAKTVEAHPELVRAFLRATKKGWIYALDHPEETVDLILEKYNGELDRAQQIASLAEIAKLVRTPSGDVLAPMDPAVWAESQRDFLKFGLIPEQTDLEDLLDFRFNP
jgi:ABC-type nitrate/sulfonate/bicarbonate transport system substrate-binding protein